MITQAVIAAVKELYGQDIPEKQAQLQKTRAEFEGNLTLVVFPFLKMSRKAPEATAQEIGEWLKANCPAVSGFNVVKGFLNLSIGSGAWIDVLKAIDSDGHYGEKQAKEDSPLVMIEYSSPNTNKPLHLGHVRNNLLGWSLAQIMQANGNKVVKTNIVNDRGIHICKSMLKAFCQMSYFQGTSDATLPRNISANNVSCLLVDDLRNTPMTPSCGLRSSDGNVKCFA